MAANDRAPEKESESGMKKFQIDQCNNGWIVHIKQGADQFSGRVVFHTLDELFNYLRQLFPKA